MRKIKKRPFYGTTKQEPSAWERPHREIARRAAAEGIVLLKNDRQVLPLEKGSSVALFGAGASHMIKGGTGSTACGSEIPWTAAAFRRFCGWMGKKCWQR